MKRYIIPTIIVLVLASGVIAGCSGVPSSEPTSTQTPTTSELQAQVEALQEELNQLREQKKAETLRKAEAYYAVVQYCSAGSSEEVTIKRATAEDIAQILTASGQFWGLIRATEDAYLLSKCQPQGEWHITPCSCSQVKDYAEGKYRELMSEYYSQQYIEEQLALLEHSMEESAIRESEEKVVINNLPFTYTGKGNGRTPAFWNRPSVSPEVQYKLTFTTTWDGDISITWYREDTLRGLKPNLITMLVWRSTGVSFGLPEQVEAGKTYEYIFNWSNSAQNALFLNIENAPVDGEWTITVSQMDFVIPKPELDITLVIEYEGKWAYQVTTTSSWSFVWYGLFSGNKSKVYENIQLPWHCRARKEDEGTDPLVVKLLYNGEVVAQDTAVGEDDEAYVFWEGP